MENVNFFDNKDLDFSQMKVVDIPSEDIVVTEEQKEVETTDVAKETETAKAEEITNQNKVEDTTKAETGETQPIKFEFSEQNPPSDEDGQRFYATLSYLTDGQIKDEAGLEELFKQKNELQTTLSDIQPLLQNNLFAQTALEREVLARLRNGGDLAALDTIRKTDYNNLEPKAVYKEAWMSDKINSKLTSAQLNSLFDKHFEERFGDLEEDELRQAELQLIADQLRPELIKNQEQYLSEYTQQAGLSAEEEEKINQQWFESVDGLAKEYEINSLPFEIETGNDELPQISVDFDLADNTKVVELTKNPYAFFEKYMTVDESGNKQLDPMQFYQAMTIIEHFDEIVAKVASDAVKKGIDIGKVNGLEAQEARLKNVEKNTSSEENTSGKVDFYAEAAKQIFS